MSSTSKSSAVPDRFGASASSRRTTLLASFGGALEYYDFIVYGVFAAEIARTIFPASSPLVSLLASFGAFAVGYLARPVGGIVMSHFGDRFGRRRVFIFSILGMSLATMGMGLVQPYAQWGMAAPAAMVLLRLLQGFCLGGELPGAITYVVEVAPRKASFNSGFVFFCVMFGVILATVLSLVIQTFLPPDLFPAYGWRIPFWIGGALGFVGFWVRLSLEESPEFERIRARASSLPFAELLHAQPGKVLSESASSQRRAHSTGCSSPTCPHISRPSCTPRRRWRRLRRISRWWCIPRHCWASRRSARTSRLAA